MKKDRNDVIRGLPDAPYPIFDTQLSIQENIAQSAQLTLPIPQLPLAQHMHKFFDYTIQYPLGIPACPITGSSAYIRTLSQLGFSIFTHKTIRSTPHAPHSFPHAIPVKHQKISPANMHEPMIQVDRATDMRALSLANSIGNSSDTLDIAIQDIVASRAALHERQVLIASIYGSANNQRSLTDDWIFLAHQVTQAGAHAVEANFSCPNLGHHNPIYFNIDVMQQLIKHIATAINPIPLIIKVGLSNNALQMENMMLAAARAGARGICGINSVNMRVLNKHNQPAFGTRTTAGISGASIFDLALDWVKTAHHINKKHNLNLTILGTGGITLPEQFDRFFQAGANIAMSGTGTMWDPYLAIRYNREIYNANNLSTPNTHDRHNYAYPAR